MAEAIENVIDDWLISHFDNEMGATSSYTTLKLAQPTQTAILKTVESWKGWLTPSLGIANRYIFRAGVMHPHVLDKRIPYVLTFVTHGTQNQAIRNLRTILVRAENVLRALNGSGFGSLVNDGGERVNRATYFALKDDPNNGSSRIRVYPDPETKTAWFCAGDISVVFHTTTGDV